MNTQRNETSNSNKETKQNIVLHADLLQACSNEIPTIVTYGTPTKLEIGSDWYISVCCSIRHVETGRTMSAIGVASKSSLHNDLQRANPIKTAEIRAFDRAMMHFMGFDESCISDWEIGEAKPKVLSSKEVENETQAMMDAVEGIGTNANVNIVPKDPTPQPQPVQSKQTAATNSNQGGAVQQSYEDQRRLFADDEVMLIGDGLVGYTYDVVKNFKRPQLLDYLAYLGKNPGIHYDDEAKQEQLNKMYEAAKRTNKLQQIS